MDKNINILTIYFIFNLIGSIYAPIKKCFIEDHVFDDIMVKVNLMYITEPDKMYKTTKNWESTVLNDLNEYSADYPVDIFIKGYQKGSLDKSIQTPQSFCTAYARDLIC
ncbi:uncharacterized protein LOC113555939 isoform X2 [Rhopalosiphum maidis]|uniref:uncharacterized protein LOC113555939 isoform X2 n=1 Tax=Rhopalosiphum maidis TaxID=43146 RepID=UPI000EFEA265|nr:uncharacterized protein LOC113555939 isoform X2 [Rhopalosiphum maidis]